MAGALGFVLGVGEVGVADNGRSEVGAGITHADFV